MTLPRPSNFSEPKLLVLPERALRLQGEADWPLFSPPPCPGSNEAAGGVGTSARTREAQARLGAPELVNEVEEGSLCGAAVMCCSHAALSDGAFALNIENA